MQCPFYICNHLVEEVRAGCFISKVSVFLSRGGSCSVSLPCGAVGKAVVYSCGIFWPYSLLFGHFIIYFIFRNSSL